VNTLFAWARDAANNVSTGLVSDSVTITLPQTGTFPDVPPTHFAFNHVEAIVAIGITKGCQADNPATPANEALFCPDNTVTRGQMAAFIARAENGGDPTTPCVTPPFSDVPVTDPFCPHVQFVKTAGIAQGFPDGTYRLTDPVTREQMAAFIIRGVAGEPVGACGVQPFSDVPTNNFFCKYIERMKGRAITLGFPDGTYKPDNGTLRAEMAVFLGRAYLLLP
jgi:hypothetical protein